MGRRILTAESSATTSIPTPGYEPMVLSRISSNSSVSRKAEWGSNKTTMLQMALSIRARSSTSSTYSRLILSYTSANSRASSHGKAAGLDPPPLCVVALAVAFECSASTLLVTDAEKPKTAPATRAISVRDRVDIISSNPPVWMHHGYYSRPSWVNPERLVYRTCTNLDARVADQCTISMK